MTYTAKVFPLELRIGDVIIDSGFIITDGPSPANLYTTTRVWGKRNDGSNGYRDFNTDATPHNLVAVRRSVTSRPSE